jgi:hypothetical protein
MRIKRSFLHPGEASGIWIQHDRYHDMFAKPLDFLLDAIGAKKPKHLPIGLTKAAALKAIEGRQVASIRYMASLVTAQQCIACAACMGYNRRTAHYKASSLYRICNVRQEGGRAWC